jgi:hypothetical protein
LVNPAATARIGVVASTASFSLTPDVAFMARDDYLGVRRSMTTDKSDGHNRLVAAFLANLNNIDAHREHEFRQGYPKASDAEIKMLCDADKKAAYPPHSLAHAKLILSDNVWVFTPASDSPHWRAGTLAGYDNWRPPYKRFCAFRDHWRPDDALPAPAEKIAAAAPHHKAKANASHADPRGDENSDGRSNGRTSGQLATATANGQGI